MFEKTFQKILNSDDYKVPDKIIVLTLANKDAEKYVVSWARHSSLSNKTPYILRNKNHWYVADNPFIFSSNQDRYMIFADVLFDMVDEKPLYPNKKPALIRVEDVNIGYTTPKQLTQLVNLFRRLKMKFSIALIPIFYDPLMTITKNPGELEKTINDSQSFLNALKFAEQNGASFIWHGVTHQYNNKKNPFNGMSGADFEFWDATKHTPIEEDSPTYVINRLQRGADVLSAANIKPSAWMPSHYLASPLDCILFGQLFYWNVGKVTYFVYQATDLQKLPQNLTFNESWPGNSASRLQYLSKLTITSDTSNLGPQMFPYEIYQDYYGQRVIPEDVGNLQPFLNNQVVQVEDIDDMIKIIRRNRVLRDVWASYFIHPFLLNSRNQGGIARYPGDVEDIQKLVVETQNAGYEFIDLKEWVKQHSPH
ncbi:MAG: DUF2334 domain-containing protein [Proteobacteria bacterium]|nr:DUF2334 domain-containing protein [Pseudomonadota bacterium]